jgi:hypothetical protein
MLLEGTLIEDRKKDTLLYAGELKVNITDWFFLKDKIELEYIGLQDATVFMHREDSTWNYQFLIDYFSGPPSVKKKKKIQLDLKKVEFKNIHFLNKDEWRGENILFHIGALDLDAKELNISENRIDINTITMVDPLFSIYNYTGYRPKKPAVNNESITRNDTALLWNPQRWHFEIGRLVIKNGIFKTDRKTDRDPYYYFDGAHMAFSNINSDFKNIVINEDTITAAVALSTQERSGFRVRSLKTNLKMHPQGMEFSALDIRTNKSHLTNFFAMRYEDFGDMSDFIEKVRLEGNFRNSQIESDDIAFFAPAVSTWKKRIVVNGNVKGSVSNLSTRDITINAGKNTLLKGDVKIIGLPDIEQTFIDVKARELRTTYNDAVAFVPDLRKITEPRLDRLETLRFNGYFTGFIRDFVTSGSIQTKLGTIVSDVNMKIPVGSVARYSGNINTTGFDIGSFLDIDKLGLISFNGKVKGMGLSLNTMQAELDGAVKAIDYSDYRYTNIKVKGTLARRLFNGAFSINDTTVVAQLNGLIDFSKEQPQFDFTAAIEKANLKKLQLYKDNIDLNGQFEFRFTGSNIDNFLGTAKIYNASVYRNGQRIAFDSLTMQSSMIDNNKSIVVLSNEFDAVLVGEFSIRELPNAFQIFLNRYFPSYINPSVRKLTNENFSFVVTTKQVDDYLALIDEQFKGFNNSSLSGRINSKQSLFNLDAEVPQFNFKNISFNQVKLTGRGNFDTLTVNTKIGDVLVNDSLHFPDTEINIQSSQDISKVNITTSASQTLNAANISGQVQTLRNGVMVLFNPSTFDINGKKWTIDKDGEIILSRELITSDGLRIYNAEQEIFITSVPSSIGTSNDLQINLKKINIGDFTPFFAKDYRMEGLLTGAIEVSDPFGNLLVDVTGEAEHFRLENDSIGKIDLTANYSKRGKKVNAKIISDNENYDFDLGAIIDLADTANQGLDLSVMLDNTSIHLLERYLSGTFTRMSGFATGNLKVVGPFKNLKYLGEVSLRDGGLMVNYTKCYYKIPAATFKFQDGVIDFGSFPIRDTLNNTGQVTVGKLYHQNFKDLAFNFQLQTNQLLVLNTKPSDNNQFYGSVVGKVNMSFTGPLEDMRMDIKGEPTDTSNIFLPIGSSRETGEAGFIIWKVYGREMQEEELNVRESNITVTLDVTANRYANVFVIMDELTGDVIEAKGTGNIKLRVGTREDMSMTGRYNIESGNYNFSFQSIKRNFKLREDAGSYISWNGDPMEALINLEAVYTAENVKFSDLISGASLEKAAGEDVKRHRGEVMVVAKISERLLAPKISFRIELPPNSPLRSNQDVATIFSFIENDPNELNKQVSFLIVFNAFGPYTGGGAQGTGTGGIAGKALEGIVVNSISGFLSNILTQEFSSLFQDLFNDKSLKVNISASVYSGTNLTNNYNRNSIALPDRTNVNFSINKSYFNERLTFIVGGALDFGLNTAQQNQSAAFPFLPDVTAEWKLSPEGKFRLTFFYRENYSYLGTGGKQNRSGTSISYRREFDHLGELLRGKKNRKPAPAPRDTRIGSSASGVKD